MVMMEQLIMNMRISGMKKINPSELTVNMHTDCICEYDGVAVIAIFLDNKFSSLLEVDLQEDE